MEQVNFTDEKSIEKIYTKVKNNTLILMSDFLDDSIKKENKEKILKQLSDKLQIINKTYGTTKEKFKYTKRESGELYFEHVYGVLEIYIENLSNVKNEISKLDNSKIEDVRKALKLVKNEIIIAATCLDHDSIEDTDITFEGLRETSGDIVAFSTLLLSKNPFIKYIKNESDLKEFEEIKKTGILNSNGLVISDKIKIKLYIDENIDNELEKFSITENHILTQKEKNGFKRYKILEKKYRKKRNRNYYSHLKSKKALISYAKKLQKEKKLDFSKEEFETIILNVILVKIADRIHNLGDLHIIWGNKPKKIEAKLLESEEYLLPLALEVSIDLYNILKNKIYNAKRNIITNDVKDNVNNKIK